MDPNRKISQRELEQSGEVLKGSENAMHNSSANEYDTKWDTLKDEVPFAGYQQEQEEEMSMC